VDNTKRYVVQSGKKFENVPVCMYSRNLLHQILYTKGVTHTPGRDLMQNEVGSQVMAYFLTVRGNFLGIL
jgi:hypothetical protein